MKKSMFSLIILVCTLTLTIGCASADNGGQTTYSSLYDYVSHTENAGTYSLVDQNAAMIRVDGKGDPSFTAVVEVKGRYTDYSTIPNNWYIGWYKITRNSPLTTADQGNLPKNLKDLDHTWPNVGTFDPEGSAFGIYLNMNGEKRYCQAALNPKTSDYPNGIPYANAYQVQQTNDHRWIIGFDTDIADGLQYNDIIVFVQPVGTAPIPEFPTVALPIGAVLGIIFIFGRKKGDI